MASRLSRESGRGAHFALLVCALVFSAVLPASAQERKPQTPKSTLVVWAKADLANQGASRSRSVVPSATAPISHPPDPRIWLLELTHVRPSLAASLVADAGMPSWEGPFIFVMVILAIVFWIWVSATEFEQNTHKDWNKRLESAKAVQLETDNFSDAWVRSVARERRKELLKEAASIERQEAQRQVGAKQKETEYREVAAYAAEHLGLNEDEVVEMLRKADELPYRLLQAAKEIKREAA